VTLAELAAREAIRDLVARYVHAADGGRIDELAALFTVDGVLRIDDRPAITGRAAIAAFLRDAAAAGAAPQPVRIRHHVSSWRGALEGADTATGAAYFLVLGPAGLDHWGRYRDRYVRLDGRWSFTERRVRVDGVAPGSWAAARRARRP
jgi:hypothetical protein